MKPGDLEGASSPVVGVKHPREGDEPHAAGVAFEESDAVIVPKKPWDEYGERLDERLLDLQDRIHRGSYHPLPVRRVHVKAQDAAGCVRSAQESDAPARCRPRVPRSSARARAAV